MSDKCNALICGIDGGSCQVNGWCKPGADGTAVPSDTPTKFRVMSRINESYIRILILIL